MSFAAFSLFFLAAGLQGLLSTPSLTGTVLDSVTGRPVAGARVRLVDSPSSSLLSSTQWMNERLGFRGNSRADYEAMTDAGGRFTFGEVRPSTYWLVASGEGYAMTQYGQRAPGSLGLPLDLAPSRDVSVTVRMAPMAIVGGRALDDTGQPVSGLPVYLLRTAYDVDIGRRFEVAHGATTDEEGRYELTGLPPGGYALVAGNLSPFFPNDRALSRRPWVFYPATASPALAGVFEVVPGARLGLADLEVTASELYRVSGRLLDSETGNPPPEVDFTASHLGMPFEGPAGEEGEWSYDPDTGAFEGIGLPEGRYMLAVAVGRSNPWTVLGVDGDLGGLELRLPAVTTRITERVTVDGSAPSQDVADRLAERFRFGLYPVSDPEGMPPLPEGEVRLQLGAPPGLYRLDLYGLPNGHYLRTIRVNGAPASTSLVEIPPAGEVTLDIDLSADAGGIVASIVDESGDRLAGVAGLLLPDPLPPRIGYYREFLTGTDGRFEFTRVPPGRYRIYAWRGVNEREYFNRALLRRSLPDAAPVVVDPGVTVSVRVEAIP